MIKVLAQADDVIGKISPPPGIGILGGDPAVALAKLLKLALDFLL
jgi:hypothetical protein